MSKSCCDHDLTLSSDQQAKIKYVLWIVFAINLAMFFLEIAAGFLARSGALKADSLDMLADAFVYGVSLYVLNKHHSLKARASLFKGMLMFALGLFVVGESIYKFINPTTTVGETISAIGFVALVANAICFLLLWKYKSEDVNMKSAWVCSRNDIASNIAIVMTGFLVVYLRSTIPDILVGVGMSILVLHSSLEIIRESWKQSHLSFDFLYK